MDIQRSLSSAYASVTNFTRNVGNTVCHYGSRAIEQGRLGANHVVSEVKHNPRAAAFTAVALLAVAGATAYMLSGTNNEGSSTGTNNEAPKGTDTVV